jgi:hypothetical protein
MNIKTKTTKCKIIAFYIALLILVFANITYFIYINHINANFTCKGITKLKIDTDEGVLSMLIIERIRFLNNNKGVFQFEGVVNLKNKKTYLERAVYLSRGKKLDSDTYKFKIEKTGVSPSDTTSDFAFNQVLSELTSDNKVLSLDITKISSNAYIISNQSIPQFTCINY